VSCAVCGAGAPRRKLRVAGEEILECPACGLAWWQPGAGHRAEAVYDTAYFADPTARRGYDDYGAEESALRRSFARRLARLPRPPSGSLLDLGAAYGFGVAEARRAGWRAFGLELSRAAAGRARGEAAGRMALGSALRAPFALGSFDAVTLWDVLEHLPDPHAAAAEVARLLRSGGRVALTTGDVGSAAARLSGPRWHLYNLPEHLFFYSRESLSRLLEAHGLRVESMRAEGATYSLGYLAERARKTLLPGRAARPARFPGSRLTLRLNLFDIVRVEAVRVGKGRC